MSVNLMGPLGRLPSASVHVSNTNHRLALQVDHLRGLRVLNRQRTPHLMIPIDPFATVRIYHAVE